MIEYTYVEQVKLAKERLEERLLTGASIADHTTYREIVGEIRGLTSAINIFNELRKKGETTNERNFNSGNRR